MKESTLRLFILLTPFAAGLLQPFELTKVLGEVLRDRRNAGKIPVKYERKEHCFHITVR
ncbi:MAG: hypothetical protein KBS73_01585 [Bacteroidales bacterium]|nr:hypothetical protein [Candidatus Cacconaster equifaecalis]